MTRAMKGNVAEEKAESEAEFIEQTSIWGSLIEGDEGRDGEDEQEGGDSGRGVANGGG
jgi:hypothetical protein